MWADPSHRMSKSCHTSLLVLQWPKTFSPSAPPQKRKRSKQHLTNSNTLPHLCITHCDIYSTETNSPLTPEFSHNSGFCLTHAVSSLGWQKSSSYAGTYLGGRLGEREHEDLLPALLCLGLKAALVASSHVAPSTCKGAGSALFIVPVRRGVASVMSSIESLVLVQVGSHLSVFPSTTCYCELGIWALEWDRLIYILVEFPMIHVVQLFNTKVSLLFA